MLGIIVRLMLVICVEMFFGVLAGMLVLIPIAAISSPNISWSNIGFTFVFSVLLIAPIIGSIYTWSLRSWIMQSKSWAIVNTVGALLPGWLMFFAVILGLRTTTMSELLLSIVVIIGEWCIGIAVVVVQSQYLVPRLQNRNIWIFGGVIGWSFGALLHLAVALSGLHPVLSLWIGSAVAFSAYGIIAHCILAYFAVNIQLVKHIQKMQSRQVSGL
jgi:hypothetical protein